MECVQVFPTMYRALRKKHLTKLRICFLEFVHSITQKFKREGDKYISFANKFTLNLENKSTLVC